MASLAHPAANISKIILAYYNTLINLHLDAERNVVICDSSEYLILLLWNNATGTVQTVLTQPGIAIAILWASISTKISTRTATITTNFPSTRTILMMVVEGWQLEEVWREVRWLNHVQMFHVFIPGGLLS